MTKVDTAMIMAAGLGRRMRPLTNDRPKPLVKVGGKAMIDHCLEKLVDAGLSKAVINTHYLADMLEQHLRDADFPLDITFSDERAQLMETGGGLVQAEPLIDSDPFFSVNSDNLWTDDGINALVRLTENWVDDKMDALLLLVPTETAHNYNGAGDFEIDGDGRISRRKAGATAPLLYSGIQLLSKRLLRSPPDGPFSTNLLWDRAIAEGRLFGLVHTGEWFEVGTPEAIAPTEAAMGMNKPA